MCSFVRLVFTVLVAAALPAAALAASVSYEPPAGTLPAGPYHGLTYSAILPSGRLVTPAGTSVVTGMDALGFALSPDGRYAIVSNDARQGAAEHSTVVPAAAGGPSLTVVDTATMRIVSRYSAPGETYFVGIAALRDPADSARTLVLASGGPSDAVYAFSLDAAGQLTPDARGTIPIPGPSDPEFADAGHSGPATIALAPDGRRAYVADEAGDSVAAIDIATRRLAGPPHPVGFLPFGVAAVGSRVLVTNEGLMRDGVLAAPLPAPPMRTPAPDERDASSLSILGIRAGGAFVPGASVVPMDQPPDGLQIVGGAHPTAIATTADGAFAFVTMTGVDRIATVALNGRPHVVDGIDLRLFDFGPYGTQPCALALSRDGSRLYVALAGLDAVAVLDSRDPLHLHRLGLIPTGWAPSALALSSDDRTLFVLNQKGFGREVNGVWSTLQRIDLAKVRLADTTRAALGATRNVVRPEPPYPAAIRNVVLIVQEDQTFDAVFGDLGEGPADPAFVRYGAAVTPNLHALARRFALAGNLYADAERPNAGHQLLGAGIATAFTDRTDLLPLGDGSLGDANEDPADYPRVGYLFDALARAGISYRDYGDFLRVAGYTPAAAPAGDEAGLGGTYAFDVPAPAALAGHVDMNYPGWNPRVPDTQRAAEFVRDFGTLVAADAEPRFTEIWLPGGAGAHGLPAPAAAVADDDRALGTIVDYLTHLPSWPDTAILIVPADTRTEADHVAASRTYALVVSPYAKPRYVGMRHLSTVSVLKTIDGIFGLPPLSLGDLLAYDMRDFFGARADDAPYVALR